MWSLPAEQEAAGQAMDMEYMVGKGGWVKGLNVWKWDSGGDIFLTSLWGKRGCSDTDMGIQAAWQWGRLEEGSTTEKSPLAT